MIMTNDVNVLNPIPLITEKLISWIEAAIKIAPNLLIATLMLTVFYFLSKTISKVYWASVKTGKNSATELIDNIIKTLVICTGFFIALGILNLDKTVTSILAGAGVIGLAIGFAFQEIISNFICGVLIILNKPYKVGDVVSIGEFTGSIDTILLRTTNIKTFDGLDVLVPNKQMFTSAITNFTKTNLRRIELVVGVSYNENLRKVADISIESIKKSPINYFGEIEFYFTQFADSSINFSLRFWVDYTIPKNYMNSIHEAIIAIKEAFDKNGITIPFPIRTIEISDSKLKELEK